MEMDLFGFYQEHFYVRDERLLSCLVENSKVRLVPKNEVFQRMGQVNPNLDIMVHGLVRGFFPDCTGKDITDCFEFSPGIPLMTSFELNEVSVISMEALRETVMVSMPLARLMPFLDHPAVMRFYVQFLSRALRRHWESKMILSQYSAKDRYRWFLGKYPDRHGEPSLCGVLFGDDPGHPFADSQRRAPDGWGGSRGARARHAAVLQMSLTERLNGK